MNDEGTQKDTGTVRVVGNAGPLGIVRGDQTLQLILM